MTPFGSVIPGSFGLLRRLAAEMFEEVGGGLAGDAATLSPSRIATWDYPTCAGYLRMLLAVRCRYGSPGSTGDSGTDDKGRPYNRVVWRRVGCANGGQHRVEIERHYDGDAS